MFLFLLNYKSREAFLQSIARIMHVIVKFCVAEKNVGM